MTSEDQTNQGLDRNSGSAGENAEELYPDSPAKFSYDVGNLKEKKVFGKQALMVLGSG